MKTGIIFDIKEFAVYDGPGIRTTVFMKGCPLRCQWCHNPEGLSPKPQLMISPAACIHCGACQNACHHKMCITCGACVSCCPLGLRRIAGTVWTSKELALRLLKNQQAFSGSGGGVTFSGGEPMMQWSFIEQVLYYLPGIHIAIETSGYTDVKTFSRMCSKVNLIMMDIKLINPINHKKYTGVDNDRILMNLKLLKEGNTPYIIRIPLIPGVNDDENNMEETAAIFEKPGSLIRVELLPYHITAGAKYSMIGLEYQPQFDTSAKPEIWLSPFHKRSIPTLVL